MTYSVNLSNISVEQLDRVRVKLQFGERFLSQLNACHFLNSVEQDHEILVRPIVLQVEVRIHFTNSDGSSGSLENSQSTRELWLKFFLDSLLPEQIWFLFLTQQSVQVLQDDFQVRIFRRNLNLSHLLSKNTTKTVLSDTCDHLYIALINQPVDQDSWTYLNKQHFAKTSSWHEWSDTTQMTNVDLANMIRTYY